MSVASADLFAAINTVWDVSGLDEKFKALWSAPAADYPVLHDQEATPGQPFPFCVMGEIASSTTDRMSGGVNALREVRDVSLTLDVYAETVDGDARTGKGIAAYLAEEIMKVFGGHPTQAATGVFTLDNGKHLINLYDSDHCIRVGDNEYMWQISYTLRVDVPLAV